MRLYNILRMKSLSLMNWFLQQVFCCEIFVLDYMFKIVFAIGKRLFSTWLLLYRTWENRSSSVFSTSSARDNWLEDESPDRMPRRMTASSLCLAHLCCRMRLCYSKSVCLSVGPSQTGVKSKLMNVRLRSFPRQVPRSLVLRDQISHGSGTTVYSIDCIVHTLILYRFDISIT